MAYYVVSGFSTPGGVDSREKVKEYQRQLGVKADGIWGKDTQAAYDAANAWKAQQTSAAANTGNIWSRPPTASGAYPSGSYASGGYPSGSYASGGSSVVNVPTQTAGSWGTGVGGGTGGGYDMGVFEGFYSSILSKLNAAQANVPKVKTPSTASVKQSIESAIYPSVERAKRERETRAVENKAEIDADAYARGMGASSYISSMKDRENEDVADDIADIEKDYEALLADKLDSAMRYYAELEAEAAQKSAAIAQSNSAAALSYASQWYMNWLKAQETEAQRQAELAAAYAAGDYSQTGMSVLPGGSAGSTGSGTKSGSKGSGKSGSASSSTSSSTSGAAKKENETKRETGLGEADYRQYVSMLTSAQRTNLFSSGDEYWRIRRQEIIDVLGQSGYEAIKRSYNGASMGGGRMWQTTK